MPNLKWLRVKARGRFNASSRRWRWLGRAPPVRTRCKKMATSVLQRKYYPTPASAASRLATYSAFGSLHPGFRFCRLAGDVTTIRSSDERRRMWSRTRAQRPVSGLRFVTLSFSTVEATATTSDRFFGSLTTFATGSRAGDERRCLPDPLGNLPPRF